MYWSQVQLSVRILMNSAVADALHICTKGLDVLSNRRGPTYQCRTSFAFAGTLFL